MFIYWKLRSTKFSDKYFRYASTSFVIRDKFHRMGNWNIADVKNFNLIKFAKARSYDFNKNLLLLVSGVDRSIVIFKFV